MYQIQFNSSVTNLDVVERSADNVSWQDSTYYESAATPDDLNMTINHLNLNMVGLERDIIPQEYQECSFDYTECRAQKYLFLVMAPILMTLSVVGNSLTVSIMMRPRLRKTATGILVAALAVSDTVANLTGLSRHLIFKAASVRIHSHHSAFSIELFFKNVGKSVVYLE